MSDDNAKTFDDVLDDELSALARARERDGIADANGAPCLTGLALSGGGIRSATFCLGVLQTLARRGILRRFDYLSCVSGGNYIGTWLSSLIYRRGGRVRGAETVLERAAYAEKRTGGQPDTESGVVESHAVAYLRSYSNYLAPKAGGFTVDTWTAIATYLRNLILNQTMLVLFFAALLLVPQLIGQAFLAGGTATSFLAPETMVLGACALLLFSVVFIALNLQAVAATEAGSSALPRAQAITQERWVVLLVMLPGLASAILLGWAMFHHAFGSKGAWLRSLIGSAGMEAWVIGGAVVYGLSWLLTAVIGALAQRRAKGTASARGSAKRWWIVGTAPFAGLVFGGVLYLANSELSAWTAHGARGGFLAAALGPVIILIGAYSLTIVAHIGLAKRAFTEGEREWWSRLGAWSSLIGLAWLIAFAVIWLGPALWAWGVEIVSVLGIGWFVTTVAGVMAGADGSSSGKAGSRGWREMLLKVAPSVFVIGALVAIAIGLQAILDPGSAKPMPKAHAADANRPHFTRCEFKLTEQQWVQECDTREVPQFSQALDAQAERMAAIPPGTVLLALLFCVGLLLVLSGRIDINLFSFHQFYRNRLTRCYLGATRNETRAPHPFTRFDPADDLPLAKLASSGEEGAPVQRPFPIVNTALNISGGGKHLAWQQRQACSFAFTPLVCGFEFPASTDVKAGGWVNTSEYMTDNPGGPRLGSLMAVSGAAASPNAGYHTSPQVAFLLSLFNVRLGRWFPRPGTDNPEDLARESPMFGAGYLLKELFAAVDEQSPFVYLSDGGHFENLGIYELVRRRCRFIVACDGSADSSLTFEDLGNASRKCRIDLGADIEICTRMLTRLEGGRHSGFHCAVGTIWYDPAERDRVAKGTMKRAAANTGTLVYIKATLTGDEPMDVVEYASAHPAFPHEPTSDQFFDEAQFESYRRLGLHIGDVVFDRVGHDENDDQCTWVATAAAKLGDQWSSPAGAAADVFTRYGEALQQIETLFRTDAGLAQFAAQLFPDSVAAKDRDAARAIRLDDLDASQRRTTFFAAHQLLQLMENVYLDLNLDSDADWRHADNSGWNQLFQVWGGSRLLRDVWQLSSETYGRRFAAFVRRELKMTQDTAT